MPSKTQKPPPIPPELAGEEVNKYGVPLSFWATLNMAQKNYYYNKLSKKNCSKAAWKRVSRERKDRILAKARQWREENLEKRQEWERQYRLKHVERNREWCRRYYHANHAKMVEKHKRRWAKDRSKKKMSLSPDVVYRQIDAAVSRTLPKFARDDVVSAMCLAVLDGKLLIENIGKEAKKFVTAYNREYDHFKTMSLDAPINGCEGITFIDRLADPAPSPLTDH